MFGIWESRGRLVLDEDGVLWQRYKNGFIFLGPIESADVDPKFIDDAEYLADMWFNASDDRSEQLFGRE